MSEKYWETGELKLLRLQELDLSTLLSLFSRELLNEEDREEEVEGMLRFDDRSLDLNKLPSLALLLFSPEPELGLILRKEELEEGLDPADSSSLLRAEPLSRKVESISPGLRNEPDPPPGLQDMALSLFSYNGDL